MRIYYLLTTLSPIIVSQTSATTHNHECLDYIPGSAILGAFAAILYAKLTTADSWEMFHSGAVKFGPCYPAVNNQLALPIPASWHFEKGQQTLNHRSFNQEKIHNHASQAFEHQAVVQYKQCRSGYITSTGKITNIKRGAIVKTAIDRHSGIAKENALFSYAYIEAKQTFIGWIESDNSVTLERLQRDLNREFTIGRSRNTEFGRVQIDVIGTPPINTTPTINQHRLMLWCLSDCQCFNRQGLPTLAPQLADIVPQAEGYLDTQHSFIRDTTVRRFNQKRQGLDSEQLLIAKGSILVYQLTVPLTQQQLNYLQKQGVGINQQQGLGWIIVNPTWAEAVRLSEQSSFHPIVLPPSSIDRCKTNGVLRANSTLIDWVNDQCNIRDTDHATQNKVTDLLNKIGTAYRDARQYTRVLNSYQAGPSSSQWHRINTQLRNNNTQWQRDLFDTKHGICKAEQDELGWGIQWYNHGELICFGDFLEKLLKNETTSIVLALVERICRYDLSSFKGLKQASSELGFKLINEPTVTRG